MSGSGYPANTPPIARVTDADRALHADVTTVLSTWPAPNPGQAAVREAFLAFLAARSDATRRRCAPGHITASAVVLTPDRRQVLLTLHPRLGRWVQVGGHCERTDATLAGAALREATEETGIAGLRIDPVPVHLDVHPVTCSLGIPTRHFDVRFRVSAPSGAVPAISDESDDLRFWPVDDLPAGFDAADRELIAAALAAAV